MNLSKLCSPIRFSSNISVFSADLSRDIKKSKQSSPTNLHEEQFKNFKVAACPLKKPVNLPKNYNIKISTITLFPKLFLLTSKMIILLSLSNLIIELTDSPLRFVCEIFKDCRVLFNCRPATI